MTESVQRGERERVRDQPRTRRAPVIALLVLVLAGAGLVDRQVAPAERSVRAGSVLSPVAAPATALSSTWFCAGATARKGSGADGSVWIANPGDDEVHAEVTIVPLEGEPVVVPVTVPPFSRRAVRHGDHVDASYAAAMVELDAGGVGVEHAVAGPLGEDVAPCASSASDRWFFADGSTTIGSTMVLTLFNPFPEEAIADISFTHEEGRSVPADFQGVVVPARGLTVINVGERVRRRENIAAAVRTRSGRLVADRIQLRESPVEGLSLTLGAPAPGTVWYFPEGGKAEGVAERLALYNPGRQEAQVDVELTTDEAPVEPFSFTIAPHDRVIVDLSAEERVPAGPHAITVRSLDDVPVVAERWLQADTSSRSGIAATAGARAGAKRWLFPVGASVEHIDEWIVVQNVSEEEARLDFTVLANGQPLAVDGLQDVVVPAGARRAVRLGDHIKRDDLGLLVTSTVDVVAERDLYRARSTGISTVIGIPLAEER